MEVPGCVVSRSWQTDLDCLTLDKPRFVDIGEVRIAICTVSEVIRVLGNDRNRSPVVPICVCDSIRQVFGIRLYLLHHALTEANGNRTPGCSSQIAKSKWKHTDDCKHANQDDDEDNHDFDERCRPFAVVYLVRVHHGSVPARLHQFLPIPVPV